MTVIEFVVVEVPADTGGSPRSWHRVLERGTGLAFQTGRFTQTDPIGLRGGDNLYRFANSDPVNLRDPLGLYAGTDMPPEWYGSCLGGESNMFCDPFYGGSGACRAFPDGSFGGLSGRDEVMIEQLDDGIQRNVETMLCFAMNSGVSLHIVPVTGGFRTCGQQDALYAQGRTAPGSIVTNASCGHSNHETGKAIDLQGTGSQTIGQYCGQFGGTWGGTWKSIKDYPHCQW